MDYTGWYQNAFNAQGEPRRRRERGRPRRDLPHGRRLRRCLPRRAQALPSRGRV
jgi:hypothetical protein